MSGAPAGPRVGRARRAPGAGGAPRRRAPSMQGARAARLAEGRVDGEVDRAGQAQLLRQRAQVRHARRVRRVPAAADERQPRRQHLRGGGARRSRRGAAGAASAPVQGWFGASAAALSQAAHPGTGSGAPDGWALPAAEAGAFREGLGSAAAPAAPLTRGKQESPSADNTQQTTHEAARWPGPPGATRRAARRVGRVARAGCGAPARARKRAQLQRMVLLRAELRERDEVQALELAVQRQAGQVGHVAGREHARRRLQAPPQPPDVLGGPRGVHHHRLRGANTVARERRTRARRPRLPRLASAAVSQRRGLPVLCMVRGSCTIGCLLPPYSLVSQCLVNSCRHPAGRPLGQQPRPHFHTHRMEESRQVVCGHSAACAPCSSIGPAERPRHCHGARGRALPRRRGRTFAHAPAAPYAAANA